MEKGAKIFEKVLKNRKKCFKIKRRKKTKKIKRCITNCAMVVMNNWLIF